MTTSESKAISESEASCQRLMTISGIGKIISSGVAAAVGTGEAYDRGRDFAACLGSVPRQHSTGGRTILGRITKRGSSSLVLNTGFNKVDRSRLSSLMAGR